MCDRLGIPLRSRDDGGRLYAPKRTPNVRKPFDGTRLDRAYLQGFARGDLDVRRVSSLALMISSTTTHPDFVSLFESLFRRYGPVYFYPIHDDERGYRWKVAARLDNSFAFMLPEQSSKYPRYRTRDEFFAWLAGPVDSDGSVGIIHGEEYARVHLQVANEDIELLRHIRTELSKGGYHPDGPYLTRSKGYVTPAWNIEYKGDMHYLLLQRYDEVTEVLGMLPLRHKERCLRRDLVLRLGKPLRWSRWSSEVRSLRSQIRNGVKAYERKAEEAYNKANHKRRRESPTLRLSQASRQRRTS